MLFNSPEFIFLFLPAAVLLHFALARHSVSAAVVGTTASSLLFYAWWNPPFVVLPVASILANFWLARRMVEAKPDTARRLLIAGIIGNLLVLGHYKYSDFVLSIVDGRKAVPAIVPLALSFTTFVQLAFLVYVHQRRPAIDPRRYALFVAFFPHLIAGPIVRWGSFGRQIEDPSRYRVDWSNIALGLTIFVLGLAKKVLIADPLAPHIGTLFDAAARGEPVTAPAAWIGCFAFTSQIYFDFSGYSDMAVGLGLLFNFRLPINFAAPLRSTSMFDLWRRWHVTLSRLARDLVYVPLSRGDTGTLRRSLALFLTMVLIGIWHGSGWPFVAWGAYNGVLILINQAWRSARGSGRATRVGRFFGWALTLTVFACGAVFFRGADIETSWHLIRAMAGFGGIAAPQQLPLYHWDDWLIERGLISEAFIRSWFGSWWTASETLWTVATLAIALLVPDTMEIVNYREGDAQSNWRRPLGILAWRPSAAALVVVTIVFTATFFRLGRVAEFLYYQF